ncbi:MAG: signal transduction histidine kinase [Thalassolituus oleivorans]|jgi:signal transduction histidine kinase
MMAEFPDMNPGPVLRLRMDGTIEMMNSAARIVLGENGVEGECWVDICPDMDRNTWKIIQASTEPVQFEAGTIEQCYLYTHTCRPDSGHIFVFGADVTAHRQAERLLGEQQAKITEMAKFPDMNPGPVVRFTEDGSIKLANRAARTLFDKDSLVGLKWNEVCPGMTDELWERITKTNRDVLHEARVGDRTILFAHTPRTEAGSSFVFGSDITEQKEAERLLTQSEKMATLGTLSAGVAHELNNPAAATQRGAEHLKAAFGKFQRVMVRVGQLKLTDAEFARLLELDELARERAGAVSTLSSMQRMDLEQELEDWMGARSVADRFDLLDELVDAQISVQELEALSDDIPEEHLDLVLEALARSFSVYQLLQEINHGAERISIIVGALKDYSYLDQAPIQEVDVNKGVRNTLIILNAKLKGGIEFVDEMEDNLPGIQAFGSELNQVWTNLIDNAISAMDGRGSLKIRSMVKDGGVCVEIEDTGPGIPEAIQNRVFDAFFTTKPQGEGTGLGLHTCYSIVVGKHGGRLTLSSKPGGTCFSVWLPMTVNVKD